jgi:hypothetical protein
LHNTGHLSAMDARVKVTSLHRHPDSLLVIHYSCEGLDDSNSGLSPRITSIAVLHVGSKTLHSFSIHLIAEILRYDKDVIDATKYDELEKLMLEDFFAFASEHQHCSWIHWKMSNIVYGFETLEHRYRVHHPGKSPYKINDSKKFDLSALLLEIYGKDCVDHPHMPALMELNGGKPRDMLTGKEEADAFRAKEFVKMHKSTISKVYWFNSLFTLLCKRKVKTARSNIPSKIHAFSDSWLFKLMGIVALAFTLFQIGETGQKYVSPPSGAGSPPSPAAK